MRTPSHRCAAEEIESEAEEHDDQQYQDAELTLRSLLDDFRNALRKRFELSEQDNGRLLEHFDSFWTRGVNREMA